MIEGFIEALAPTDRITVSEWADENRVLSPIAASEPGLWRTMRTPYLKYIMDCLSSYSPYKRIVVMKGAQLGFTEAGNNWLGYIIDNSPAPTLMVQPTDDMVKRNSKMRIDTMIKDSPSLTKKVAKQKSRSGENTISQKNFPGGILLMAGANSPAGLRSVPIKNLFLDEVDAYPYDLGDEGSPIELAIARTRTFNNKKIFIISTPTVKGCSAIEREFDLTDQNYFEVPCPHCGTYQVLKFENLKWEKGKYEDVQMVCPECGALIEERFKTKMMSEGKWVPSVLENSNKETIGFHISSLYSPYGWYSWKDIAQAYDKALEDPAKMKVFVNTVIGKTNEESGESPAWQNVYNRRENYAQNTLNNSICLLTCGVDIQKDRIELEIVGWCLDKQSYSIDYRVLLGNTTLPDVWDQLAKVIDETWRRPDDAEISISKIAIDSGYNTTEVHDFCRKHPVICIPIKGQDHMGISVSPPRQIDYSKNGKKIGKLKQWNIGVSKLKSELYSWLTIEPKEGEEIPCYCHFPQYDERYFEGLTAEDWLESRKKWIKKYERNEPLDCRIYARAASIIMGLDRMKPETKTTSKSTKVSDHKDEVKEDKPITHRRKNSFWNR